ncbi:Peptide transporter PTR2 [Panicum miliaceum]|uniref:Peptide transporter PTR2 n=1 Tax=Panicum miliaceum TaxID=4540 RepID=A0A3L6TNI9_PANMI|nr:Peptide transporter PTR2 [Panicum miliaceum]
MHTASSHPGPAQLEAERGRHTSRLAAPLAVVAGGSVSYLTKVLHETNVAAARNVSAWQGTTFLTPLVGAFIADSYLGNYWTALIFITIFIIGMMLLVLSATSSLISTNPQVWPAWTDTISSQHIIFFFGLYMVAIGYDGQNPCVKSFGADQFDDTDEEERTKKSSFLQLAPFHTQCWFFDKAAIVTSADCESVGLLNTLKVCTVSQVEEFKILIRMLPIWATMVLFTTVLAQMFSTFIEQGMVMDKHIGWFEIPAASFQCVDMITVLALVPVYVRILVPVFRKFTSMVNGITPLQRMGSVYFSPHSQWCQQQWWRAIGCRSCKTKAWWTRMWLLQ